MKKRMISTVSLLLCLVLVISFCITAFAEGEDAAMICEKADSWNALFDRSGITNDWLAADGHGSCDFEKETVMNNELKR